MSEFVLRDNPEALTPAWEIAWSTFKRKLLLESSLPTSTPRSLRNCSSSREMIPGLSCQWHGLQQTFCLDTDVSFVTHYVDHHDLAGSNDFLGNKRMSSSPN